MAFLSTMCLAMAASESGPAIIEPQHAEVFRQPQIAMRGSTVAVAFGTGNKILFVKSGDGGKTFTAPVTVADQGMLSLGNHRGPRVVMTGNAMVVSAIYGDKGRGADGDLLAWRSTDGGQSWSKAVRINDQPAAAREGLHAMTADGDFLYAVWLDDRDGGKTLYGASSTDGGVSWTANKKIYTSPDGHICECCHPSVVVRNGGKEIYTMFRNWLGGSRDMYLAKSMDGGRTFTAAKLGEGTWELNACPMDGGSLVVEGRGLAAAWRRSNSIFVVRPGEKEQEIGTGKNVAMAGGVVAWSAPEGLWVKDGPGKARIADPAGAFPAAASDSGKAALAWESGGRIKVCVR